MAAIDLDSEHRVQAAKILEPTESPNDRKRRLLDSFRRAGLKAGKAGSVVRAWTTASSTAKVAPEAVVEAAATAIERMDKDAPAPAEAATELQPIV